MKNTIKVHRARYDMTQDELAKKLEVSRQTINAIENNKYYPSLELGLKLSEIFKCTVNELFQID